LSLVSVNYLDLVALFLLFVGFTIIKYRNQNKEKISKIADLSGINEEKPSQVSQNDSPCQTE
jgi:hypothetical protein